MKIVLIFVTVKKIWDFNQVLKDHLMIDRVKVWSSLAFKICHLRGTWPTIFPQKRHFLMGLFHGKVVYPEFMGFFCAIRFSVCQHFYIYNILGGISHLFVFYLFLFYWVFHGGDLTFAGSSFIELCILIIS
jgi:hypothetical protein